MKSIAAIWKELLAVAAVLIGSGAQFVDVPPEDTAARPLAIFCVAALVSLAYAAMRKWDRAADLSYWVLAAIFGLAGVLAGHYRYSSLHSELVVSYAAEQRVIGTVLTETAAAYKAKHPDKSNGDLLFDAGGNAVRVWTEPSIRSARNQLRYGYLLCAPLVGATVIASTQVARLTRRRRRRT